MMGSVSDLLGKRSIFTDLQSRTKQEALEEVAETVCNNIEWLDLARLLEVVHDRDRVCNTAMGRCIAFPHARLKEVKEMTVAVGLSAEGIEFDATDGQPVHCVILLVTPEQLPSDYLDVLALFARIGRDEHKMHKLLSVRSPAELIATIKEFETSEETATSTSPQPGGSS